MAGLLPDVDPDGLLEYSVVYSDRSLNHMSQAFGKAVRAIGQTLRQVYDAQALAIVPGGGTFAMEAVARQLATEQPVLVVRNGWFSYRWSQILEAGAITSRVTVLKARPVAAERGAAWVPPAIDELCAAIERERPAVLFAPQVETSAGLLLPPEYLRAAGEAMRAVGGLFVVDAIAAGTVWAKLGELAADVVITAPQKGWSASPCAGLVLLGERALERVRSTRSSSFACDLGKWLEIQEAFERGGHAYHATMPTDGLRTFARTMQEIEDFGFARAEAAQWELGRAVRALLAEHGFASVAAPGFEAPSVVVCHTQDPEIKNGARFAAQGLQVAAGVPLVCDEPEGYMTFRIGLFGLEKLQDVERTVAALRAALEQMDR